MTATLDGVAKKNADEQSAEQQAAVELVRMAREQGLSLTGPDGLLKQLTKTVIETALSEEMTEHLGYEKHDPAGAGGATSLTARPAPHPAGSSLRDGAPRRRGRARPTLASVVGRTDPPD